METIDKWKGKTALVTGASSGIGEAFSRLLAKGGCNVIVTARRLERLESLAAELAEKHGVETHPVACDLSESGAARELIGEIENRRLHVDLLVNNAGVGLSGSFVTNEWPDIERMIRLNVTSVVELTRLILPGMLERGGGDILIVGSVAAYMPAPTQAVYGGTKAFVHYFGCALAYELRGKNVNLTVLNPGGTSTEFMQVAGYNESTAPSVGMMTPESVAASGLRALAKGKYFNEPGLFNQAVARLSPFMPMNVKLYLAHQVQKFVGGRK